MDSWSEHIKQMKTTTTIATTITTILIFKNPRSVTAAIVVEHV